MKNSMNIDTPVGVMNLVCSDGAVTALSFGAGAETESCTLLNEAKRQLEEYFAGKRKAFDLPLNPEGTEFQRRVWEQLRKIPFGETRSYGFIAEALGNPKACRAVGMANNKNPIAVIIPCHRVVGANGALTGYAGGLDKKEFLLNLEHNL